MTADLPDMDDPPHPGIDRALVFNTVAAELTASAGETGHPGVASRMHANADLARQRVREALAKVTGGEG